jgi:hypothetical protein
VDLQDVGDARGCLVAEDERDEFAAGREHAVEDGPGGGRDIGADHGHVAVDEAQDVPGLADAGHGPGLAFGDGDLGVAGRARRRGHRDDVLVEAALRLVHGERGDPLDRGARRDQRDPDALGAGLLGGSGGGVPQVGVIGQQHDLTRVCPPYGRDQLPAGGRLPGAREHGGRAGLAVEPRQTLARHHGDDGPLGALPGRPFGTGGVDVAEPEVGDPDPVRPSGLDARLHGGARVVDVHVDVPQAVAADHDERVAEGVQPLPQPRHGRVVGLQEVDHLEGGPALARGAFGRTRMTNGDQRA